MTGAVPFEELVMIMVFALVGVPLAGVLHEATHVLFVWPVAASVTYKPAQSYVEAEVPNTRWRQRWADLAGVAPVIVGSFSAIFLVAVGNPIPSPLEPWGMLQWGLWMAYSITGGLSDYMPEVSRQRASQTGN